jgi:hypothetical protein
MLKAVAISLKVDQLLAFLLYKQFKAKGVSFKTKYLKVGPAGRFEAPTKILSPRVLIWRAYRKRSL